MGEYNGVSTRWMAKALGISERELGCKARAGEFPSFLVAGTKRPVRRFCVYDTCRAFFLSKGGDIREWNSVFEGILEVEA